MVLERDIIKDNIVEDIILEIEDDFDLNESDVLTSGSDRFISQEDIRRNAEEYNRKHMGKTKVVHDAEDEARVNNLVRRKGFEVFFTVALIILVGLFAMLVLYPEMQLAELSRDISDAKDRIAKLQKEIVSSEEEINGVTDMDSLRAQGLGIGMQDPNANQIVNLPMPKADKLTTIVAYDANGVSEEAYNTAVGNLADYYLVQASQAQ